MSKWILFPLPQRWPKDSDGEKVCLSESPPCHWLSLSISLPKRSIFLPFVMSERCLNDVGKNYCCLSALNGLTDPCHIPGGQEFTLTSALPLDIPVWQESPPPHFSSTYFYIVTILCGNELYFVMCCHHCPLYGHDFNSDFAPQNVRLS